MFNWKPNLLCISGVLGKNAAEDDTLFGTIVMCRANKTYRTYRESSASASYPYRIKVTWGENSVSWTVDTGSHITVDAYGQLNSKSNTYFWCCLQE